MIKLNSNKKSNWLNEAKYRQTNEYWLKHSRIIALNILSVCKFKGISKLELAEKLECNEKYVNKILSGKENLDLKTISKLEIILDINIINFLK